MPTSAQLIETHVAQVKERLPEAPVPGILLARLIIQLGRDLVMMMEQQIRPFGLAEVEFRVLMALLVQPDGVMHPGDLCPRITQSPANISRIGDALVARGLITRELDAYDRRRMVLRITPRGEELVRQLLPSLWTPLRTWVGAIAERDQLQLVEELKCLSERLESLGKHLHDDAASAPAAQAVGASSAGGASVGAEPVGAEPVP